jgi:hypothetical protein
LRVALASAALAVADVALPPASQVAEARTDRAAAAEKRKAEREKKVEKKPEDPGPLVAVVSLPDQRISVYAPGGRLLSGPVSTGRSGYETPAGIYNILEKKKVHYSNIYRGASMPFMQRITWSGIALHAGDLPGYPASHGCIRLPYEFAPELFGATRVGMRVIVAKGDIAPAEVAHAKLFVPQRRPATEGQPPAPAPVPVPVPVQTGAQPGGSQTAVLGSMTTASSSDADNPLAASEAGVADEATRAAAAKAFGEKARATAEQRKEAGAKARQANKEASEARKSAAPLLAEIGRLQKTSKAADRAEASAKRAYDAAVKAADNPRSAGAQEKLDRAEIETEQKLADASQKAAAARMAEAEARERNAEVLEALRIAEEEAAELTEAWRELVRDGAPVSVLVSGKTGMLQVRQAFDQIYEAPVTIRDPGVPLGTHIFTAVAVEEGKGEGPGSARWTVVSLAGGERAAETARKASVAKRGKGKEAEVAPARAVDVEAARASLERIEFPKEAIERVADLLVPGSSLIISDEGPSRETGKGTDFIIQPR